MLQHVFTWCLQELKNDLEHEVSRLWNLLGDDCLEVSVLLVLIEMSHFVKFVDDQLPDIGVVKLW